MSAAFLCGGDPTTRDLEAIETFGLLLEDLGAVKDGDLPMPTFAARWDAYAAGVSEEPTCGPWPWEVRA